MSFLVLLFAFIVFVEIIALIGLLLVWRKLHRWQVSLDNAQANFHFMLRQGKSRLHMAKQVMHHTLLILPFLVPFDIRWEWQLASWVFKELTRPARK